MKKENLDDMLQYRVTEKELAQLGLEFADLGIKVKLEKAKRLYLDKKGLAIQMEDGTYLTAEKMQQVMEDRKKLQKIMKDWDFSSNVP